VDAGQANGDKEVQVSRLLPFPNTPVGQFQEKILDSGNERDCILFMGLGCAFTAYSVIHAWISPRSELQCSC